MKEHLLTVSHLLKYEKLGLLRPNKSKVPSIDNVSFSLYAGENLGLIGESGSGKTTLGKCIVKLEKADKGSIHLFDQEITQLSERQFRPLRQHIQMIFQDLDAALNPGMRVHQILEEILSRYTSLKHAALQHRMFELLSDVNLELSVCDKMPGELSGGQKRRIAIAAILAIKPKIIIADELTTGLDHYTQMRVLQLMQALQKKYGLSILFISHDLQLVQQMCQRIAVLYFGSIIEIGDTQQIVNQQAHPYTQLLWQSHLNTVDHKKFETRKQDIRSGLYENERPSVGCRFAPRCPRYIAKGKPKICIAEDSKPKLKEIDKGHQVACHFSR